MLLVTAFALLMGALAPVAEAASHLYGGGSQVDVRVCGKENSLAIHLSDTTGPLDTGVSVRKGDVVYIHPDPLAAWDLATPEGRNSNAEGLTPDSNWCTACNCRLFPPKDLPGVASVPNAIPYGTLVYKVDEERSARSGIWRKVGAATQFVAEGAGELFLANWDEDWHNNAGCIGVRISKVETEKCRAVSVPNIPFRKSTVASIAVVDAGGETAGSGH